MKREDTTRFPGNEECIGWRVIGVKKDVAKGSMKVFVL